MCLNHAIGKEQEENLASLVITQSGELFQKCSITFDGKSLHEARSQAYGSFILKAIILLYRRII